MGMVGSSMGSNGGGPSSGAPQEEASAPTGWRHTFSSLQGSPDFRNLFIGNIGFFFGMNMMIILRGWLVQAKWDNAAYLGFIMAMVAIPMLLLSPIAGVVTDRVDRRKLIISESLASSLLLLSLAILDATNAVQIWHVVAIASAQGLVMGFDGPVRSSFFPLLIERKQMMSAVALGSVMWQLSRIIGPLVGAALIVPIGIGGAYVIATAFYAFALVATFLLPPMAPEREKKFTFFEDFVGGFRYIKGNSILVALMLFATVPMIFAMPYMILLPVFADRVWDVGEIGFSMMQAAGGAGGLVGAMIIANMGSYPKKTRLLVGGGFAFAGFLILFALAPAFYMGLIMIAFVGFGSMIFMTVNNTSIQLVIPDEMRGRVMSVMMMTFGLMPLGAVPAGVASESFGVRPVVAIGGALCIAVMLVIFFSLSAFRRMDEAVAVGQAEQAKRSAAGPARRGRMPAGVSAGQV